MQHKVTAADKHSAASERRAAEPALKRPEFEATAGSVRADRAPRQARRIRLAIVSTYPPRRCGLATFAADLYGGLAVVAPDLDVSVCALDRDGLAYPSEVTAKIAADDPADYRRAAHRLHAQGVDVVLIQHEYGIFAGRDGWHVLGLADELTRLGIPYVVTLHTVLSEPEPKQTEVLAPLCKQAAGVTVFSGTAVRLALAHGIADPEKLMVIPHGAPPQVIRGGTGPIAPALAKVLAESAGRRIVSTFGLLSRQKGIEFAIDAIAEVARRHPDVRYIVAGATHPDEVRREGEQYRIGLQRQVRELGLDDHVRLVNDYLAIEDLAALLRRTEIYLTPYKSREQISSGALTYAVAAGCAAVSTDYHYARDLITPEMGALVAPCDPAALARALIGLLGDDEALRRARGAARRAAQRLSWPAVAGTVADLVRNVAPVGPRLSLRLR